MAFESNTTTATDVIGRVWTVFEILAALVGNNRSYRIDSTSSYECLIVTFCVTGIVSAQYTADVL